MAPTPSVDDDIAAPPRPSGEVIGGRRSGWVVAAASVLSALWSGYLARRGWFVTDDFWNLAAGSDRGLSWDLLGRDVLGHVSPGFNLLVWLIAVPGGSHYGSAVVLVSLLAAAVPPMVAWAARSHGADGLPAAVAGGVAAALVPMATASTWWTASLVILPPLLAGAAVLAGAGRSLAGSSRGLWIAAGALTVGLMFTEGAAVVLVAPVVLALGRDGEGPRWRRVAGLWGAPSRWLVLVAPFVVLAVVRASASEPVTHAARPSLAEVGTFPPVFLVRGLLPSFVGLSSNRFEVAGSPALTVVFGLVGTLLIGAVLGPRLRPGVAWGLAAATGVVLARGVVVAVGRLTVLGWADAVEVRYIADLVWLFPFAVAVWWSRSPEPGRLARPSPRIRQRAPAVALVIVVLLGLVGQHAVASRSQAQASRRYLDRYSDSWSGREPGQVALDAVVPASVVGPEFGSVAFVSRTVALDVDVAFGPDDLLAPDVDGTLQPVALGPLSDLMVDQAFTAEGEPGVVHRAGCWAADTAAARVWVPLARPVTPGPYVLDLALTAESSRSVSFVAAGTEPARSLTVSPEGRWADRWIVVTAGFSASQIGFDLPVGEKFCLGRGHVALVAPR